MSVKTVQTNIPGCYLIEKPVFRDQRGDFFKMFEEKVFSDIVPSAKISEVFFSTSHKNVLRGLHFQTPPQDHFKIVSCLKGKVLDVVLDLREGSPTMGQAFGFELSAESGRAVFIPRGCAHGFLSLEDESLVAYLVETGHSPQHDQGILWSSIDFAWPVKQPVLSDRDNQFPALKNFKTPFRFKEGFSCRTEN